MTAYSVALCYAQVLIKMETTKVLQYLKELVLTCSICNEELRNPKSLPCLHVFCRDCIATHITKNSKTVTQGQYKCPECKETHLIPGKGANSIRDAFLQKSLLEVANLLEKKSVACSSCDATKSAQSACLECGVFQCDDCKAKHASAQSTRSHRLSPIDAIRDFKTLVAFQKTRYNICEFHSDEHCKLFCNDDETEICSKCRDLSLHKLHEVTALEAKLDALKAQTDKIQIQIEADSKTLYAQKHTLTEALKRVRRSEKDALEAMSTRVQYLSQMVTQYEKQVTQEIKRVCMDQQDIFQSQLQDIEACIQKQKSLENRIKLLHVVAMPTAVEIARSVISEHKNGVRNVPIESIVQGCDEIKFVVSTHAYANLQSVLKSVIGFISSNIR